VSWFRVALSIDVRHKGKAVFDLSPLAAKPPSKLVLSSRNNLTKVHG
jgi:hypothetical protein